MKLVTDTDPRHSFGSFDRWIMMQAPALWASKYGEDLTRLGPYVAFEGFPENAATTIESGWATTIGIGAGLWDLPIDLNPQELAFLDRKSQEIGDMPMAELWIMMTVAGWKPGMAKIQGTLPTPDAVSALCNFYRTGGIAMAPLHDIDLETALLTALDMAGIDHPVQFACQLAPTLPLSLHDT